MSSQIEPMTRPGERLSDAQLQEMLSKAVRLYAERMAENDSLLPAFASDTSVTATDVMVTVTAMLKAVNLQVFELGMWQAWAGK
jgi:hypothetical protein